jgi:hypothetical protein
VALSRSCSPDKSRAASRSKEDLSRAALAEYRARNNSKDLQWVSLWIHRNRFSFSSSNRAHKASRALQVPTRVATRRQPYGKQRRAARDTMIYAKTFCRMGELEPWIDENFVRSVWFGMGYQVNVKMIRDKFSG